MNRPHRRALLVLTVTAAVAGALGSAPAQATPTPALSASSGWCSQGGGTPCITTAEKTAVDGTNTVYTANSTAYSISADYVPAAGNGGDALVLWNVQPAGSNLTTTDLWSLTIDMGTVVPRATDTFGAPGAIFRHITPGGDYHVSISGYPTRVGYDNCDQSVVPWSCKYQSTDDRITFAGEVDNFGQWDDPQQRDDVYGMDSFSNAEAQSTPPQFIGSGTLENPFRVQVDLANSYQWQSGTVAQGFYFVTIPTAFIKDMGIDDPSTMTAQSMEGTAGSGNVNVDPQAGRMRVSFENIVFPHPVNAAGLATSQQFAARHNSMRHVQLRRGVVTPTWVRNLTAHRVTLSTARVAFSKATARGSRITGYQARCVAPRHATRYATGTGAPITVHNLAGGVCYTCSARAHARAGYGKWVPGRTVAGRPN